LHELITQGRERVTRPQKLVPPHPHKSASRLLSPHTGQAVREKHLKQREILREA